MGLIPQCMRNKLKMYVYIAKFRLPHEINSSATSIESSMTDWPVVDYHCDGFFGVNYFYYLCMVREIPSGIIDRCIMLSF